jgi:hypothetical protein
MKIIGTCRRYSTSSGWAEGERYDHKPSYQLGYGARLEKLKLHNRVHTVSMEQLAGGCYAMLRIIGPLPVDRSSWFRSSHELGKFVQQFCGGENTQAAGL